MKIKRRTVVLFVLASILVADTFSVLVSANTTSAGFPAGTQAVPVLRYFVPSPKVNPSTISGKKITDLTAAKKNNSNTNSENTELLLAKKAELKKNRLKKWQQAIEYRYNLEKYLSFKKMSDDGEHLKKAGYRFSESEKIKAGMASYEKSLKDAASKAETSRRRMSDHVALTMQTARLTVGDFTALKAFLSTIMGAFTSYFYTPELFANRLVPEESAFVLSAKQVESAKGFLIRNLTPRGLPLSYRGGKDYWKKVHSSMDSVDSVLERVIVEYTVNIYDAAVWQIALQVTGDKRHQKLVDEQTRRLLSGSSGSLKEIRAYGPDFKYGDQGKVLKRNQSFFFRIIADEYIQADPMGKDDVDRYPNFKTVHHEDWKPITGEQAWAAIIGPLQVAYEKYGNNVPLECPEMRLAYSILPAVRAMQSPIGAIYHAPAGTHQKNPRDISNENNFSMYAALKMFYELVRTKDPKTARVLKGLIEGQENYFKQYAYDWENGIFFQGGHFVEGKFIPTKIFAVDCQTWAIGALGVEWIDGAYGDGASYRMWKNTIRRSGYFDARDILRGVGFTDDHRILSGEWTCGAILATKLMAKAYAESHPGWAQQSQKDANTMRRGLETIKVTLPDGSDAYYYANRRYFIPFGWWANPLPSLVSTSWVLLIDRDYNPFMLGGGPDFIR